MRHSIFTCLLALAAGAFPSAPAAAGVAAGMVTPRALTLQLQSLDGAGGGADGPFARVDVGTVTARGHGERKGEIQVRKRVALRLDGPHASARVSVALVVDIPGCIVRVDGHTITTIPRLIDPVHRVGARVVHEIVLTIPASVPPGPFLGNLHWVAEAD